MEVVRDGGFVEFAEAAFLRAQAAGEIAEVIYGQGHVRVQGFTNGFAVVHGFGIGQQLQIRFQTIGNLEQDIGAFRNRGSAPLVGSGMSGIERQLDIFRAGARGLGIGLAGDGGDDVEIFALHRGDPLAADEIVVFGFVLNLGAGLAWKCVNHDISRFFVVVNGKRSMTEIQPYEQAFILRSGQTRTAPLIFSSFIKINGMNPRLRYPGAPGGGKLSAYP
ncbi:hypothetical protein GALL_391020 [mine drainage metagenome]|uniref:Uncharacterized protein n=1 Tax=mine drainage metagenome TaxID=410659 RepID=A0A1J5QGN4_9ZZZZ